MRKFFTLTMALSIIGIFALVAPAPAQFTPVQDSTAITSGATTVDWDVPAAMYGPLLSLQSVGVTNAGTLAVSHLVAHKNGTFTNTVETAAAGNTLLVYPSEYVPAFSYAYATSDVPVVVSITQPKPVYLARGDKLRFTVSAANGSAAYIAIRAGLPGK